LTDKRFCGRNLRRKRPGVDGLKVLPEAVESVFVHLARCNYRTDRKRLIPSAADAQVVRNSFLRHRRRTQHTRIEGAATHQHNANQSASPEHFLITAASPLRDIDVRIPNCCISLGVELRFIVPIDNFPLRLGLAYNPNAQTNPPPATFLAPEKRFAFRIGFGRTL
jgi:hypothetical protein